MQSPIEATFAQHVRNIAFFLKIFPRKLKIPSKIQCRYDRSRHYFGVAHLTLRVFMMMKSFQHIIAQAKHCYNLAVHVILSARFRIRQPKLYLISHGLSFTPSQGGNLGYLIENRFSSYLSNKLDNLWMKSSL